MCNSLLDAISLALHKSYPNSGIHSNKVTQGLDTGAFFISVITSAHQQIMGNRYQQKPLFEIQYYPQNGKEECYAVAENLSAILECITVSSGMVRGREMRFEVVDEVLHFFVNYGAFLLKSESTICRMESLEFEEEK